MSAELSVVGDVKLMGHKTARVHTPLLSGASKVDDVIELANMLDVPLLEWQEWALRDLLMVDADGMWVRKLSGLLIARQQGKTHLARMLIIAHLVKWDSRNVLAMSHNRKMALDTFRQVVDAIDGHPQLRKLIKQVRIANGLETLILKDGSKYEIVASSAGGSRGKTADFLYIDELREIDEQAWAAATYTTSARPNSMTLTTSNAGDAGSTVLNDLRTRALTATSPALGWYEWSANPTLHITDRLGWQQANPSMGILMDESVLEQHLLSDRIETFKTEALCLWVDALESPWQEGSFAACQDTNLVLIPGRTTWLAVDISPHRRTAVLVAGQVLDDGRVGIGLLKLWRADHSVDDITIASETADAARKYRAQVVGFDRYSSSAIAAKLAASGIMVEDVSGAAFAQACDETLTAMTHGRLVHAGQQELIDHVMSCATKPTSDGGWRIVRRKSMGDVSAAIAMAMVIHFATKPRQTARIIEI